MDPLSASLVMQSEKTSCSPTSQYVYQLTSGLDLTLALEPVAYVNSSYSLVWG